MMTHNIKRFIAYAVIAVCAAALPAAAQDPPKIQFAGGYQLLRTEGENLSTGWFAEVNGGVTPALRWVGLVSGNYKSIDESRTISGVAVTAEGDLSILMFMGGARYSVRNNPALAPFAHALLGGVRGSVSVTGSATVGGQTFSATESDSSTEFGLLAGGGIDLRLTDRAGLRIGADFLRLFVDEGDANGFRFTAGVVFPFGR
jgi:opacity protein-like surface antigen